MAHPQRTVVLLALSLSLAFGFLAAVPIVASASGLSIGDARQAAVVKVKKLQRKLRDTGAKDSSVPGCWRESKRAVGCLGMVRGADELVRWRCAVPLTVRRRSSASVASGLPRLAVEFTDTMCSF
jgi:hypothetical protein